MTATLTTNGCLLLKAQKQKIHPCPLPPFRPVQKRRRLAAAFAFLQRPLNLPRASPRRSYESDRAYQLRIACERAHSKHNSLDLTLDLDQ